MMSVMKWFCFPRLNGCQAAAGARAVEQSFVLNRLLPVLTEGEENDGKFKGLTWTCD
jgi:hypothetical protein